MRRYSSIKTILGVLYFFSFIGGSVRNRSSIPVLRGVSIGLLSVALVLVVIGLIGYSRQRNNYPAGMTIAGVPVGGVTPQIASERVLQVYSSPIEISYNNSIIQIAPLWLALNSTWIR